MPGRPINLLIFLTIVLSIFTFNFWSCSPPAKVTTVENKPYFVVTIPPLAAILREIIGSNADVAVLLQPGSSPHTYEPNPTDVALIEGALGLFYVHETLDAWAASFETEHKIAMLDMVPDHLKLTTEGHHHSTNAHSTADRGGIYDPHFWTSPLTVKAILPELVSTLSDIDPVNRDKYNKNALRFAEELDELHEKVSDMMEPFKGESLLLFHPSFGYFTDAYGLEIAGVIEPFPGKEPTPKYLISLAEKIKAYNVKAIFTEPQLPPAPAKTLSEETGLPIYILDPLGGTEGRYTYTDLILYNAETMVEAFSN
jgi:ABC-type Zn uptake system ZnuABC Zn-binding protein ZnuA